MLFDYKLIGAPKRFLSSRGGLSKSYSQRYRLLKDPPKKVRAVSLQTGDAGTARRRAVEFVEEKIREIVFASDPRRRTIANGIHASLEEYVNDLVAQGNINRQASLVKHRIERVLTEAKLTEYVQLDAVKAAKVIAALQTKEEFRTTNTANRYREALRA